MLNLLTVLLLNLLTLLLYLIICLRYKNTWKHIVKLNKTNTSICQKKTIFFVCFYSKKIDSLEDTLSEKVAEHLRDQEKQQKHLHESKKREAR